MNKQQQEKYDSLVALFRGSIEENGGVKNLVGIQFGTMWPSGALHSREEVASVLESNGFHKAAKLCREITPEKAATQAAARKGPSLCTAMSRKTKRASGEVEHFHLKALDAEGDHTRAWGVYREIRKAGERASEWELGARVFVDSTETILSAPPIDVPQIDECRAIADALARHMSTLLTSMDNSIFSDVLAKACDEAGCFSHLTRGLMVGFPGPAVEELTAALLELRVVTGVQISAEPRFRGGVSETYISESVMREMQGQLKEPAQTMASDRTRVMKPALLERRAAELQRLTQLTQQWSTLLSDWDSQLLDRLRDAERAYARASTSLCLDAPAWAVELGVDDEEDPFALPAEQGSVMVAPGRDPFALDETGS